jgi:endonuclease/exonuclease/phosphatase family metal-dependent hydrolase
MVGDSSAFNVRIVSIPQPGGRNRALELQRRWWPLVVLLAVGVHALGAQAIPDTTRPCRQSPVVTWHSLASPTDRDVLDRWCDSVGPPLVAAGAPPPSITSLVIATWNVHAGNGDVEAFLASLATLPDVHAPYGVALLLQEAVRAGPEVPERSPARMRPPRSIRVRRTRQDVGALAARLALHLAYVPSMRNGRVFPSDAREDRGNAILSTLPLEDLRAIELPFGRQRHVAVAARVTVTGLPLRVISVHLDPSGHRTKEAEALAGLLPELARDAETVVVGGDLNTWFGRRERALKALSAAVPEEDCGRVKTNSWPWRMQGPLGWWRGRLDYLFSSLPPGVARVCQTIPQQFGSDHRPVVLLIDLSERR